MAYERGLQFVEHNNNFDPHSLPERKWSRFPKDLQGHSSRTYPSAPDPSLPKKRDFRTKSGQNRVQTRLGRRCSGAEGRSGWNGRLEKRSLLQLVNLALVGCEYKDATCHPLWWTTTVLSGADHPPVALHGVATPLPRLFLHQRAPNSTEFAQPRLSRSNGGHPSERVQIWAGLFLYGWYYPDVRLQIWVCLICVVSTYSNGAVQIRVGLELADCSFECVARV